MNAVSSMDEMKEQMDAMKLELDKTKRKCKELEVSCSFFFPCCIMVIYIAIAQLFSICPVLPTIESRFSRRLESGPVLRLTDT